MRITGIIVFNLKQRKVRGDREDKPNGTNEPNTTVIERAEGRATCADIQKEYCTFFIFA